MSLRVVKITSVTLATSNSSPFFTNYSKSMINEVMKFDPIAILDIPKKMNGSDRE